MIDVAKGRVSDITFARQRLPEQADPGADCVSGQHRPEAGNVKDSNDAPTDGQSSRADQRRDQGVPKLFGTLTMLKELYAL